MHLKSGTSTPAIKYLKQLLVCYNFGSYSGKKLTQAARFNKLLPNPERHFTDTSGQPGLIIIRQPYCPTSAYH